MVCRHKLLLPSNTISILEADSNVSQLSQESIDSLSDAVNLQGTGNPFRSPSLYQLVIAGLATSIRSFTDVRFHGLSRRTAAIDPKQPLAQQGQIESLQENLQNET